MSSNASVVILMAEDDNDDFVLATDALKIANINNPVVRTHDGVDTLNYLKGIGEYADRKKYPFPDILIVDLNMPRLDGRGLITKIKEDSNLVHLPIVILTTSKSSEDVFSSYQSGGNTFIRKPANFEMLVDAMKVFGAFWLDTAELPTKV